MTATGATADSLAKWILLGALAIISLGLIGPGTAVYVTVVAEWAESSNGFHGIEGAIGWLIGLCAAAAIAAGLLVAGIMLRLLRWQSAPLASLCLAVIAAGFVMATYWVFSDTGNGNHSIEVVVLQGCSILLLLVVALPPFLHWARAKPKSVAIEPPGTGP